MSRPIWDLVIEDMLARERLGMERYLKPLVANNGRDGLRDAYEEALDLAVYLRQVIAERDSPTEENALKAAEDFIAEELECRERSYGDNESNEYVESARRALKSVREALGIPT